MVLNSVVLGAPAPVEPDGVAPIPASVTRDLEALKLRLAAMCSPDELPAEQAEAMRVEISAIRLHLKRLALERASVADDLGVRLGLRVPTTPPLDRPLGQSWPGGTGNPSFRVWPRAGRTSEAAHRQTCAGARPAPQFGQSR